MGDQFRIAQLRTKGLLGHDRLLAFGPVNYIVGGNGSGKSEVLEAIRLAITGRAARVLGRPEDLIRLANVGQGEAMMIDLQLAQGSERFTLRRTWRRAEDDNSVEESLVGTLFRKGAKVKENAGVARKALGGWTEAWEPLDVRSGGPKLRRKLIELLGGGEGLRVEDYVPPDAPAYLQPVDDLEAVIDEWAKGAHTRALSQVARRKAQLAEAEARVEALSDAGQAPDTGPITERLAVLRGELAEHGRLIDREREAERLATQVEDARARLAKLGEGASVEAATQALEVLIERRAAAKGMEEARAAKVRAATAARGRATLAKGALGRHRAADLMVDRALEALDAQRAELVRAQAKLEEEIADLEAREVSASETVRQRKDEHDAVLALIAGAREAASHLAECPSCHVDLAAHFRREMIKHQETADGTPENPGTLEVWRTEGARLDGIRDRLANLSNMEMPAVRGTIEAIDAAKAWKTAEAEAVAAEAEVPALPQDHVTEAQVSAARAAVETALLRDTITAEVDRLDLDLDVARAAVAAQREKCARAREVIDAEIEVQEEALEAAGAARSRVEDYAEAVADRKLLSTRLQEDQAWVKRMAAVEGEVLAAIAKAFEGPTSAVMGATVKLELVDARGNPCCRILRDGVDIATLSDAELLTANTGILRALGPTCGALYRPILMDRFESVELARRGGIFSALLDAIAKGEIDQAFVAGCPDVVEAPPGVTVIDLSKPTAT